MFTEAESTEETVFDVVFSNSTLNGGFETSRHFIPSFDAFRTTELRNPTSIHTKRRVLNGSVNLF